jgi:hypothetical protein
VVLDLVFLQASTPWLSSGSKLGIRRIKSCCCDSSASVQYAPRKSCLIRRQHGVGLPGNGLLDRFVLFCEQRSLSFNFSLCSI